MSVPSVRAVPPCRFERCPARFGQLAPTMLQAAVFRLIYSARFNMHIQQIRTSSDHKIPLHTPTLFHGLFLNKSRVESSPQPNHVVIVIGITGLVARGQLRPFSLPRTSTSLAQPLVKF